jgi:hypothetical protein
MEQLVFPKPSGSPFSNTSAFNPNLFVKYHESRRINSPNSSLNCCERLDTAVACSRETSKRCVTPSCPSDGNTRKFSVSVRIRVRKYPEYSRLNLEGIPRTSVQNSQATLISLPACRCKLVGLFCCRNFFSLLHQFIYRSNDSSPHDCGSPALSALISIKILLAVLPTRKARI